MSTQHTHETGGDDVEPACDTTLQMAEWETVEAVVYPPGYPRLCNAEECFGGDVPDDAWNSDNTAAWDHTAELDTLVRSSQASHQRRYHKPD